ncbi:adhesion G protein-coupled receptor E2-like isoform X2 [Salvelinus fontinalis]|uniref:adhesion G protein-coupled receptor E2-like isoform X2 n=1 Tax=Salvelinus fontinalis TaxID=8038 RepID=UPI002485320E|nr:adhesion G protein-coupled receptor E2-like isoform X2 [Salvelinus fontinalis]
MTGRLHLLILDINECLENKDTCGPNAECHNVLGSYSCICNEGFVSSTGVERLISGQGVTCEDRNECVDDITICGKHTQCVNTPGSYSCVCNPGFGLKSGKAQFTGNGESCEEITDQKATTDHTATTDSEDAQGAKDLCKRNMFICGGNGTCHNATNSGHRCACHAGFTNYGDPQGRCTGCDYFAEENRRQDDWIRDPLRMEMGSVTLPSNKEDLMVELSFDHGLSMHFPEMTPPKFWCSVMG